METGFKGFNIAVLYKRKRDGTFTPSDCNEFVEMIRERFKETTGKEPEYLMIPEDHTGDEKYNGLTVERTAKPRSHYYLA